MQRSRFTLDLTPDEFLGFYRGHVKSVVVLTEEGVRLAFPAASLKPFVNHDGVRGRFEIRFDSSRRLISLTRLT